MIPEIKKILYATDLSKNAAYAFYFTVDLARKRNSKMVILHAIEPVPPYVLAYAEDAMRKAQQDSVEESIREIKKRLQHSCEILESKIGSPCMDLVSNIIVRVGYPVEEILKAADEEECDLIVLGNHGKGRLQQTFLGSVSRSVLDRTRKPVFIIPLPSEKIDIDWDKFI